MHEKKEAVIYVQEVYRTPLKEALKLQGVDETFIVNNVEDCMMQVIQHMSAVLVLDLHFGVEGINQVLEMVKHESPFKTGPVMILSREKTQEMAAIALEFGVDEICYGDLSAAHIGAKIEGLARKYLDSGKEVSDALLRHHEMMEKEQDENAIHALLELKSKFPQDSRVDIELGEFYFSTGQLEEAKKSIDNLVDVDMPNPRALNLLSKYHLKKVILMPQLDF